MLFPTSFAVIATGGFTVMFIELVAEPLGQ